MYLNLTTSMIVMMMATTIVVLVMMVMIVLMVTMMMVVVVTMTIPVMMKDRKSLSRAVCFLLHYVWLTMLLKWILLTLGTYTVFFA